MRSCGSRSASACSPREGAGLATTADWPGALHRVPDKTSVTYPLRAHLATWLKEQSVRAGDDFGRYRMLDIGCGKKPYYPFFADHVTDYVGVDMDVDNPAADIIGQIEDLPVPDESFDLVLCTQVLEHAGVPDQAISELYRVTAPGGRVLASTHGVQVYHPAPVDHWRWTHTGLELLFLRNAAWESVTVEPAGGTATCLAAMSAIYADILFRRIHLTPVAKGLVWTMNTTGAAFDRRIPALRA